jgi:transglutaminase-like putative cysteine protease
MYQATKELALDQTDLASLDVGWDLTVKVDRPLSRPHDTQRVRYRVRLEEGDPAATFVSGPFQQVKSIDAHTAEITVHGRRPGMPRPKPDAAKDRPTEADRRANSIIQSGDPLIVALANEVAPDEEDAVKVAVALEKHVSETISQADYSQAFASAVEVAKSRRGDCTEHAVLLAALCRARGIPARVALGLVYMQGAQAFGYHAWTEAQVDGRWLGLDATRPHGGTSAAYLKVSHSSLEGASAYSSLLPVVQLAGRLEIEILEARGDR